MIYHFVVGDMAAQPLIEAVANEPSLQGEVIVLKDILHVGPLQKQNGDGFSALRGAFWQQVTGSEKAPELNDMERLLEVSKNMFNNPDAQTWLWMAPWPADVTAYHWMLPYMSKHPGRFYLVNIAGLPFLNEDGKVYFPKNLSEILPKELVKARRLARQVTPAEFEVDGEEWYKMEQEDAPIRTHEGGKKIAARKEDHYDNILLSFCSHQFQKAHKIINQSISKYNVPTGDVYLGWRLRQLAAEGKLQLQGDVTKTLKDFEVKLPGGDSVTAEAATTEAQENQN
ncbi:MAG: hypothetical protein BGO70_04085 [Bacteroidetes bacterium 43-93]|nr:DUF1835 domain-containing protein [Bacteroidota bacterium]OJW98780.1 MAG: hypothetical protein BGO70_04085 [Bacteroidetes bacterium 43-93]